MSENILLLTGSPRKNGNSFGMAEKFIDIAQSKNYEVTRYDCAFMNFEACNACNACFRNGNACSHNDDFNMIADTIVNADIIAFCLPVYWYTYPTKLKAVIDKFYSFYAGGKIGQIAGKKTLMLACCGEDISATEGLKKSYHKMISLLGWKLMGELYIPDLQQPGEVESKGGCKKVSDFANDIL